MMLPNYGFIGTEVQLQVLRLDIPTKCCLHDINLRVGVESAVHHGDATMQVSVRLLFDWLIYRNLFLDVKNTVSSVFGEG